jgi:hypothetical protein
MVKTQSETTQSNDLFVKLNRALDDWRRRVDELLVQVNLGDMGLRDDLRSRLGDATNALLLAKARLLQAKVDAGENMSALEEGIEHVLRDVKQAYDAALQATRPG